MRLIDDPRFEIIPTPSVIAAVEALPPRAVVTVTCHTGRGLEATIGTAELPGGGSTQCPSGSYATGLELLQELDRRWHGRFRVGIPGFGTAS